MTLSLWPATLPAGDRDPANAPAALYARGNHHIDGTGPRNPARAAHLFEAAATRGYAPAQTALARMLVAGVGDAAPDPDAAIVWYRKAALQGHVPAQVGLGIQLAAAGEAHFAEAHGWFARAEAAGGELAVQARILRERLERHMAGEGIHRARQP